MESSQLDGVVAVPFFTSAPATAPGDCPEQQLGALFEQYGGVDGYRTLLRDALAKELEPLPLLDGRGHRRVNVLQRRRILIRREARARVSWLLECGFCC